MDLDKLAQALSKRTQEFPRDRQADAQLMANGQKEHWFNVVSKICEHENTKSHTKVINLLNAIQRLLNDQNNVLCTSEDLGNVVQVASNLPLLTDDTENLLTRAVARQPIQVLAAFLAEASDQLPLLMERERYAAAGLQRLMTPPVIKYMCDYIAHQKINAQPAQAVIKKLQQDAESTKKTIDDAETDFSASLSSNEKEWKAFLQTAKAEKNAALEMKSLGAATRIWKQKKTNTATHSGVAL